MSGLETEGIMFDNLTSEQKEAFKSRTRAIDALLKSAVETPRQPSKTPSQLRFHVPSIHIHRLGRRLTVIDPKDYSMSDAVALMTGAMKVKEAA